MIKIGKCKKNKEKILIKKSNKMYKYIKDM